jgi:protein TonB
MELTRKPGVYRGVRSREMFEQTFINNNGRTRKPWTVAVSLALQTGVVAVLLIYPLLHPEVLHLNVEVPVHVSLTPLTTMKPPETRAVARSAPMMIPRPVFNAPTAMPTHVPAHIGVVDTTDAPPTDFVTTGLAGPSPIAGIVPELPQRAPSPAPSVKPAPQAGPVRVGIGVQAAKLIFGPKPHFSPLALAARIQGTVKLQAIIAADGSIQNLRVMSGPPLLTGSALDAVKQWRYQPTLLNGAPVEVITEIDVVFTLSARP